jgi:hypothetical protein
MHKANPPAKVRCSFTASDPVKRVTVGASTGSHESDESMGSTLVLLWCRTARLCDKFLGSRSEACAVHLVPDHGIDGPQGSA